MKNHDSTVDDLKTDLNLKAMNNYFLISLIVVALAGCSTSKEYPPENKASAKKAEPESSGPPPPPPQKKKELVSECKVMNGEGQTFKAQAGTMFQAQMRAKEKCERNYRHCTILKCESVELE